MGRPRGSLHHTCGNRRCCNANHMEALTKSDHGRLSSRKRWDARQKG